MVGDVDQRLPFEQSSDPVLRQQVWDLADRLGFGDVFIPEEGVALIDDHTPFLAAGVPAVNIIDFDYPHYHTMQDTCDKISAQSLGRVGRLLEVYLESGIFLNILPELQN